MAEFKAHTLHHRDGRERVVTTTREEVEATFDGFGPKRDVAKVAKAEGVDLKAAKKAAASTTVTPTEAPKGGPAATAKTAPAKTAAATQSPS
jgi:hypothetical protein